MLLPVAICTIPFARAQRNAGEKVRAHINQNAVARAPQWTNVWGRAPVLFKKSPIAPFLLNVPLGATCPATITESTSQAIISGNSVACAPGASITHYWRAFDMNTFTGGLEYDITSIEFGIQEAQSATGTGQSVTVNLYMNGGSPFPNGTLTKIATSGLLNIPDQMDTIFNVPIMVGVPAGTLELVMELVAPDGDPTNNRFFIGSNPDPETRTSYISANDCGTPDPVPVADIGFPDVHYVININGSCPDGSPTTRSTPTPRPRGTPIPRP